MGVCKKRPKAWNTFAENVIQKIQIAFVAGAMNHAGTKNVNTSPPYPLPTKGREVGGSFHGTEKNELFRGGLQKIIERFE
jgi:hypothetical protein